MKKLSSIFMTLLFAASLAAAQNSNTIPKFSDLPLPCLLTTEDLPAFFGVKMNMPVGDARKLFGRSLITQPVTMDESLPVKPAFYRVPVRGLPRQGGMGVAVQWLEFATIVNDRIESMAIRFSDRQTLASKDLFLKMTKFLNISPEVWLLVDHGNGAHLSWRTECNGFQAQFDAQKGLYYRLWISKTYQLPKPKTGTQVGDGE